MLNDPSDPSLTITRLGIVCPVTKFRSEIVGRELPSGPGQAVKKLANELLGSPTTVMLMMIAVAGDAVHVLLVVAVHGIPVRPQAGIFWCPIAPSSLGRLSNSRWPAT